MDAAAETTEDHQNETEGTLGPEQVSGLRKRVFDALEAIPEAKTIIDSGQSGWLEIKGARYSLGSNFREHPKLEELRPAYQRVMEYEPAPKAEGEESGPADRLIAREGLKFLGWLSIDIDFSDDNVTTFSCMKELLQTQQMKDEGVGVYSPKLHTLLKETRTGQEAAKVTGNVLGRLQPVQE